MYVSPLDPHPHPVAGAQGDDGLGVNDLVRGQPQTPGLAQGRQEQDKLHPGELLADADARAAAKGDEGELGAGGLGLGRPAVRVEAVGVGEEARVTVGDGGGNQHNRARRQHVASHGVVSQSAPPDGPGRWVQAHGLGDNAAGVSEARQVISSRSPARQYFVEFGMEAGLTRGVLGQQQPGPGQGVGRRLVAGQKQRHHLVAHLRVAHRPAVVLVARPQQHGEQVASVFTRCPVRGD